MEVFEQEETNDAVFSWHLQTGVTCDDSQQLILNGVSVCVRVCLCRCVSTGGQGYVWDNR